MSEIDAETRRIMGSPDDAKAKLIAAGKLFRSLQGPFIASRAEHDKRELLAREAKTRLAEAALLWLWHEENPDE